MSLFGTMSLFGSAGTLFYIVLSPFVNKSFSIQWRRGYLILNIVEPALCGILERIRFG